MTNTAFFTQSVVWRNTHTFGTDYCTLRTHPSGYDLSGTVVAVSGLPYLIYYKVRCDKAGQTKEVAADVQSGEMVRQLHLSVDSEGRWWRDGQEVRAFRGCADVDLGATPATNTLPVRRLNLSIGESQEVSAAWVRFPDLSIEPLSQRYTRLDERRYRYESESGFEVVLEVDNAGLITSYPGGWTREAHSNADE